MKIKIVSLFIGTFCWAMAAVEPYKGMVNTEIVVFSEPPSVIKRKLQDNASMLRALEPGYPAAGDIRWKTRRSGNAELRSGASIRAQTLTLAWMPAQPSAQDISDGGKSFRALPSEIKITVGWLDSNQSATAVDIVRVWRYRGVGHIPYTDIPFFWSTVEKFGAYPDDRRWVEQVSPEHILARLPNETIFSEKVISALLNGGR